MNTNTMTAIPSVLADEIGRWVGGVLLDYMIARAVILRSKTGRSAGPITLDPAEVCLDLQLSRADFELGMRWLQTQQYAQAERRGGGVRAAVQ